MRGQDYQGPDSPLFSGDPVLLSVYNSDQERPLPGFNIFRRKFDPRRAVISKYKGEIPFIFIIFSLATVHTVQSQFGLVGPV